MASENPSANPRRLTAPRLLQPDHRSEAKENNPRRKARRSNFPRRDLRVHGERLKGLGARLRRHSARTKKLLWHIDHLLTLPDARIKKIILYPAAPGQECRQNKRIAARAGAAVVLKNFGASDCNQAAQAIFFYISRKISCRNSRVVPPLDPGSGKSGKGEYFTKHRPRCLPPSF
jgi:Uri superfamily endonuclease